MGYFKSGGGNNPFFISDDRTVWQQSCLDDERLRSRAKKIAQLLSKNFCCIHSFGAGDARLEFLLKRENPSLQIKCSDFAPRGLERLKKVFVEVNEIVNFDMINGDWNEIDPESLCLFYRVDTELNDEQWRTVLGKMRYSGIRSILFIPGQMVTLRRILHQQIKYVIFRLMGKKMIFSGYMRTKNKFISLLTEFYGIDRIIDVEDLQGFLLSPKEGI